MTDRWIDAQGEPFTAKRAAQTMVERRQQRESLEQFFIKAFTIVDPGTVLMNNWHIGLICEYLEACYAREIQKLIINMPPRNMKSNTVTVAFPAWVLGDNPSERIITSSYSSKLSTKHSVDTRLILESQWYRNLYPNTRIASDQNEKTKFQTTERGHRIATSVGGTATGEGGNILITDDPINPKMAMSEIERKTANEWLDQTWSTRKDNPATAVEILVMQRLHMEDPTGHLLAEDDDWEQLVIPQVAESDTLITFPMTGRIVTRKKGDLLHPERTPEKVVAGHKKRLGTYGYSAQQQQRPSPLGGGLIQMSWFQRYKTVPRFDTGVIRISLDTATKDKEQNDPSVATVWLTTTAGHYVIDVWRDRVVYPELKRNVISLIEKWRPLGLIETLIEDKASGQQLIQDLHEDLTWAAVIAMEPGGIDKVTRMSNETPLIESGGVWLPESAPWLFDFEQELMNFPNAPNDDQVDTVSQFLKRVRQPAEIFIG